jgi:hypothetical protein
VREQADAGIVVLRELALGVDDGVAKVHVPIAPRDDEWGLPFYVPAAAVAFPRRRPVKGGVTLGRNRAA